MPYDIDTLERMFFQNEYAPRTSDGKVIARKNFHFGNNSNKYPTTGSGTTRTYSNTSLANAPTSWHYAFATAGLAGYEGGGLLVDNLVAGKSYTLSVWVECSASRNLTITGFSSGGTKDIADYVEAFTAATSRRITKTFTPSASGGFNFWLSTGGTVQAITIKLTAALVEEGSSVGTYFDGDSTDDNWTDYRWEGTPNASASLAVEPEPRLAKNLVVDSFPSKYANTTLLDQSLGISSNRWWGGAGSAGTYSIETGGDIPVGNGYFARKTWSSSGTTSGDTGFDFNTKGTSRVPVYGNEKLFVSFYMRTSASNKYAAIVVYYNGGGTNRINVPFTTPLPINKWVQIKGVVTLPADAYEIVSVAADINHNASYNPLPTTWNPGETLDVTGMLVKRGETEQTVFDGSAYNSAWTGTPYYSPSVLIDVNSRDRNFVEAAYYKKNSGLSVGTAADHERAFLIANHKAVVGDTSPVVATNLHPNPSLNTDITGGIWQAWGGTGGTASLTRETTGGHTGANFARSTWSVSSTSGGDLAAYVPSPVWVEGDIVRGSIWARSSTNRSLRATIQFHDINGVVVGSGPAGPIVSATANTWVQVSIPDTTVLAGAVKGKLRIVPDSGGFAAGETLDGDDALIIVNNPSYDITKYFDGSSQYARWTGTPNASISELTDPTKMTNGELLRSRFMAGSGLPAKSSMADHEAAFYKSKLGVS